MREKPQNKLDPRIKMVWRISDAIVITLIFLCIGLVGGLAWFFDESNRFWAEPYCLICAVVFVVVLLADLVAITPFRYARWRYQLFSDFLEIENGLIWRKHIVIPFIRVQNTDTRQGPLLRAFGLASVTVSTAGDSLEIPGLKSDVADEVRDRAAELARIAREDV